MNRLIKSIGFIVVFLLAVIYSIKSISSFKEAKNKLSILMPQYTNLLKEYHELNLELNSLQFKINGIRESTLNKDVLEYRVKTMLNFKNFDEILLIN